MNPFTGRPGEAHAGPPDEGENADCPELGCKGVMVPQIPRWLVGNTNRQWFECDECGYKDGYGLDRIISDLEERRDLQT